MTLRFIDDLDGPPVVGESYRVPTVRGSWYGMVRNWPVIGPLHRDREIIGFPHPHYHLDARFLTDRCIRIAAGSIQAKSEIDPVAVATRILGSPLRTHQRMNPDGLPPPVVRARLCRRGFEPVTWSAEAHWYKELAAAYAGERLRPGMICPHRGLCLKSMPRAGGNVICPAHGLWWNVETGRAAVGPDLRPDRSERISHAA